MQRTLYFQVSWRSCSFMPRHSADQWGFQHRCRQVSTVAVCARIVFYDATDSLSPGACTGEKIIRSSVLMKTVLVATHLVANNLYKNALWNPKTVLRVLRSAKIKGVSSKILTFQEKSTFIKPDDVEADKKLFSRIGAGAFELKC